MNQPVPARGDAPEPGTGPAMSVVIGNILLAGVLSSVILLVAGAVWQWIATGSPEVTVTIQKVDLFEFLESTLRRVIAGQIRPETLIELGIGVLLSTPFVRVAASVLYFMFAERNWKYTLFTCFVLAVLTCTLFLR